MKPERILFLAEGQLGDLILLTPAIRAAKTSFPQSTITVLILERHSRDVAKSIASVVRHLNAPTDSVLSTDPHVDQIYLLDRQKLKATRGIERLRLELEVLRFLRQQRFDCVIVTFPEDRFALWAFASGARWRIGQRKQSFAWLLTQNPDIEKKDRGVLEYYCDLVRSVGASVYSRKTEYHIPQISRDWARGFLISHKLERTKPIIAIHPGASGDYKIWPPERYAALIDILQSGGDSRVILCHGAQDARIVTAIHRHLKHAVVEADCGADVSRFAALLEHCSLCISNDSGPRHVAAAIGTPSLAVFRQFHGKEWQVYEERPDCAVVEGADKCPSCPPGVCLDRIPQNEEFGSFCVRMVDVEHVKNRALAMLAFRKAK